MLLLPMGSKPISEDWTTPIKPGIGIAMFQVNDFSNGGGMARPSRRYAYWVASCLAMVYALNFMDRQILSILAEPIKKDLGLSDTQIGLLSGFVFAIFYSVLAIPVARLADRSNRVGIIALCCGVWSLFTLGCGLATGFVSLALSRIGVAAGEAGGSPPSYSVLADYFPPKERATAIAIYSLGVPVGVFAGALAGAWLAASFGWRAAFVTMGLIGLVIAPLLPLAVREPARGQQDPVFSRQSSDVEQSQSLLAVLRLFVSSRVLMLTALGAGLSSFVGYGLLMWIPAFLIRDAGMTLYEIAFYYSPVSGVCLAFGTWLTGFATDRLGRKTTAAYGLVPALAALLSVPFVFLALNVASWPAALAFLTVPLVLGIAYLPPAVAVVQNVLPAHCRATGGAIFLFLITPIGLGGGPLYVGMISDFLAPAHGDRSLVLALQWLTPIFLLAAATQFAAGRAMRRSVRAGETQLL